MVAINLLKRVHIGNTKNKEHKLVSGKLIGYRLFGYMCSEIQENKLNSYLKRLSKVNQSDRWVSFRIMAVSEKDSKPEDTYFAYGEVAILVQSTLQLNTWYQLDGVIRTILYDGTGNECYISSMRKVGSKWCVAPPHIEDLDLNLVNNIIGEYIMQSEKRQIFLQPSIPQGYEYMVSTKYIANSIETGNLEIEVENTSRGVEKEHPENESIKEVRSNVSVDDTVVNVKQKTGNSSGVLIDWSGVKKHIKNNFKPVNRDTKKEKTEMFDTLSKVSEQATDIRDDVLDKLVELYDVSSDKINTYDKECFTRLLDNLLGSLIRKPNGVGDSGQAIIKSYFSKQKECERVISNGFSGSSTVYDMLMSSGVESLIKTIKYRNCLSEEKAYLNIPDTEVMEDILDIVIPKNMQACYAGIYASLFGFRADEFMEIGEKCDKCGVSFIKIVADNPYLLLLVDSDIKFLTLETLANARNIKQSAGVWRLACILNEVLKNQKGSTAFDIYELNKQRLIYGIGKRGVQKLQSFNSLLNDVQKSNIWSYVDNSLNQENWEYSKASYDEWGNATLSRENLKRAIVAYVNTGLGTVYNGVLYITRLLDKDLYIYSKIYSMAGIDETLDMSKIELAIESFEYMKSLELGFTQEEISEGKGFKLEKEQRDAVYAIDQKVLCVTGPAGSGKTTTIEAMLYCRNFCSSKKKSVMYAAPTGKAAKRLQETVKTEVKTQHSMFGVYGSVETEMEDFNEEESSTVYADYYVFDEQAMVSTNLMYSVLNGVKEEASIYFVGDIEQLVPIESGKPFADFLRFLPTVVLRVSKRAVEGSNLAMNIKRIIEKSESDNFEELQSGTDTKLINVESTTIPSIVKSIVEYHLGKSNNSSVEYVDNLDVIDADGIQVASPVVSKKFAWGCDRLNPVLQDIFNPPVAKSDNEIVFGFGDDITTLRLGSRVINTDNNYGARHYTTYKNGILTKKNKAGVMNGDVGKIVAIYRGNECSELPPEDGAEHNTYKGKLIKDNSDYMNMDYVIMVVEYYDTEDECNYYIVYQGEINMYATTTTQIVCSRGTLKNVQLAYCLSIHKLQGSESKIIIFLCGTGLRLGDFLNRNMVYTAISRAKEALYVVGNIGLVERARKYRSNNSRHSAMEDFV